MLVYRYEDARGEGPYWRCAIPDMNYAHNATARELGSHQPAPAPDFGWWENWFGAGMPFGYRFACTSIAALNSWFRGWEIDLEKKGFHVSIYEVSDKDVEVGRSGLQCVFDYSKARSVLKGGECLQKAGTL